MTPEEIKIAKYKLVCLAKRIAQEEIRLKELANTHHGFVQILSSYQAYFGEKPMNFNTAIYEIARVNVLSSKPIL